MVLVMDFESAEEIAALFASEDYTALTPGGDWHGCLVGGDGVEEALKDVGGQVGGIAAVGSETDTTREVLDRVEPFDGRTALLGQHRGRHSDRGGAAANEEVLTGGEVETDGE